MNNFSQIDRRHMREALTLAKKATGFTSPNPLVGAVIARGAKVLGRGWHAAAGEPHAEIVARKNARGNLRGATLYVTLEPCSTHGRTPPCTTSICGWGISRIVVATVDPNPLHAGAGIEILRKAGIKVDVGLLESEATLMNRSFNTWITRNRPHVLVKSAMTLDGKIATSTGESKWITSTPARRFAMKLRLGVDAIVVGVGTVQADDPRLTVRDTAHAERKNSRLLRIILDPRGRVPLTSHLLTDDLKQNTIVVVGEAISAAKRKRIRACCQILTLPLVRGRFDIRKLLGELARRGVSSILVEGGGETLAEFFKQRLVDEVAFFYAPKILGGKNSKRSVGGNGFAPPASLTAVRWRKIGQDLLLRALVENGLDLK